MRLKDRLKGIVAAVATAALALSVAPVTAMAAPIAGSGMIEIQGLVSGDEVAVYMVAETTTDESNQLQNNWLVSDEGLPNLNNGATLSQDEANLIASRATDFVAAGTGTANQDGVATISDLAAGLYLVKVTNDTDSTRVYQNTVVPVSPVDSNKNGRFDAEDTWDKTVVKSIKQTPTSISKTVAEVTDGTAGEYSESIDTLGQGDTASFKITVTVPAYTKNAPDRAFTVTDQLDNTYLDYSALSAEDVTVSADGELVKGTDYTVTFVDGLLTVDFTNEGLVKLANQPVDIVFSAKVNSNVTGAVTLNTAQLSFSKNSYNDDKAQVSDSVSATFYGLKIKKTATDHTTPLAGAEFEIRNSADEVVATLTSGSDGMTDAAASLGNGDIYTIVETKAPAGYLVGTINPVTINSEDAENNVVTIDVTNQADTKTVLPTTGGTGTVALTVVGVALMAGAAFFVTRSRKEN